MHRLKVWYRRLVLAIALLIGTQASCFAQPQNSEASREQLIPSHLLGLIHAPEVHAELKLTPAQVTKLEAFFEKTDGDWFRSRIIQQPEKLAAQVKRFEAMARQWFGSNTSKQQQERLRQLELRAQGIRMLLRQDLSQELRMQESQLTQLEELARATVDATQELQKATMQNKVTEELKSAVLEANKAEAASLQTVMTQGQMDQLRQILGAPFETSKLQRIYPMAPELVPVSDWINSSPLTLKSLRGKVVLLHFYAFQCHNCHANFDVYQRWHKQYGEDVVVLGIQTPETSNERDPSLVRKAAKERDLNFPILVDLKSENWKSWSNTMWPTVYVIDKKGYIRHWWQGELRWQGATMDQKIESIVTGLLAEDA
ncbi:MAG: redoxin domain-containing protein [Planctomycetota bacterium]|nr:redoxin domain-containing protein [Planctomycetota bacterium]